LYLNTNVASLGGIQALEANTAQQASTLQSIATGNRITSAASDPAGLAISELMQSQVSGFGQAGANAQNGISLLQTADGALASIDTILQSMNALAAEAAGGTQNAGDLADLQAEMNQYAQEITSISNTTQFNGISLLNGGFTNQSVQTGIAQGQSLTLSLGAMDAYSLGLSARRFGVASAGDTLGLTGVGTDITGTGLNTGDPIAVAAAVTGATASGSGGALSGATITGSFRGASAVTYTLTGVSVNASTGSTTVDLHGSNGFSTTTVVASTATSLSFYDGLSSSTFQVSLSSSLTSADAGDTITAQAASVTFSLTDSGATLGNATVTVDGYTAIAGLASGTNVSLGTYGNISFASSDATITAMTALATFGALDAGSLPGGTLGLGSGTNTLGTAASGIDVSASGLTATNAYTLQATGTVATVTAAGGALAAATVSGSYDGATTATYTITAVTVSGTSTTIKLSSSADPGTAISVTVASTATQFTFTDTNTGGTITVKTAATIQASDVGDTLTASAASVTFELYDTTGAAAVTGSSATVTGLVGIEALTSGATVTLGTYGSVGFGASDATVTAMTALATLNDVNGPLALASGGTNTLGLSASQIDLSGSGIATSGQAAIQLAYAQSTLTFTTGGTLSAVTGSYDGNSVTIYSVTAMATAGTVTTITVENIASGLDYTATAASTSQTFSFSDPYGAFTVTLAAALGTQGPGSEFTVNPAAATVSLTVGGVAVATVTASGSTAIDALVGSTVTFTNGGNRYGTVTLPSASTVVSALPNLTGVTLAAHTGTYITQLGLDLADSTSLAYTPATAFGATLSYSASGRAAVDPGAANFGLNDYATVTQGPSIATQNDAQDALATIGTAINTVDAQRAQIGAWMNQLQFAQTNAGTAATNLEDANASYLNANMAQVTSRFVQQNTLVQADVGVLAQASQLPAALLKLIP